MFIETVEIKNFRLLNDVKISFEPRTTVVVGRNNSGKTSLTELFRRLLLEKSPSFRLEDFSCSVHDGFWSAYVAYKNKEEVKKVRELIPSIEIQLTINYESNLEEIGALGDFVVDLNLDCSTALVKIIYGLGDGKIEALFEKISDEPVAEIEKSIFFKEMRQRIPSCFKRSLIAQDPSDPDNTKVLDWTKFQSLVQSGFVGAQRWLDDTTHQETDVLGKVLESLFKTALSDSADEADQSAAALLDQAVLSMEQQLDAAINKNITDLIPALSLFGYPGLGDPQLRTETTLDAQRLLSNHTKVRYAGADGVSLPEAYNGLGARNLIFILLQLLEFFKAFKAREATPGVHLVFIEEPEAHLHPQMAEVFIRKLEEITSLFSKKYNSDKPWPVQFIVSTHSSHLANAARFETVRYFLATPESSVPSKRHTVVKDLREGLKGTPKEDRDFLHQYMTLTRCDLFFADKAALIEGCAERLLLPKMIEKIDKDVTGDEKLGSQYVSVVEVCGAYAHLFFPLVEFLELRTLVITDIDSTKKNASKKLTTCLVSEGTHTSNACIKSWFKKKDISPTELLGKQPEDKTKEFIHLAYQVPESGTTCCGRSFEDAFILANLKLFELETVSQDQHASSAFVLASKESKSQFALRHAIESTDWQVPRYVAEGLKWLAKKPPQAQPEPADADVDVIAVAKQGANDA